MRLITDLDEVKALAAQHRDEFEVMRYLLELDEDHSDEAIDREVDETAAAVSAAIDCKRCANCCRTLDADLTQEDAQRLADGLHIPLDSVLTQYALPAENPTADEPGKLRGRPCVFLDGNLCSVYEHRPDGCRIYPALTPDFRWVMSDLIAGSSGCPIIYNVLSTLAEKYLT